MSSKNKSLPDGGLPPALDFFKYAQKDEKGKRKADLDQMEEVSLDQKRRRTEFVAPTPTDPSVKKHRMTAKGVDVPMSVETFEELRERYHMSGHLIANLSKYGFNVPTAIQSQAVPILLEVK